MGHIVHVLIHPLQKHDPAIPLIILQLYVVWLSKGLMPITGAVDKTEVMYGTPNISLQPSGLEKRCTYEDNLVSLHALLSLSRFT